MTAPARPLRHTAPATAAPATDRAGSPGGIRRSAPRADSRSASSVRQPRPRGGTSGAQPGADTGPASSSVYPGGAPASHRPARSPLAVVPQPVRAMRAGRRVVRRAPRAPFVMLLLILMAGGLLGLLLLNTALTEDAFRLHKLQQQAETLAEQEQEMSLKVDALSDPAALASRAAGSGMVPGGAPGFLPVDTPIPPGARVVGAEPGNETVLVVIPAPAGPGQGAVAVPAAGTPGGAGAGTADGTRTAEGTDAGTATTVGLAR